MALLFNKNAVYISAVLKALNELPDDDDFYITVNLHSVHDHSKVGTFSDEHGADDWYVDVQDSEVK